MLGTALIWSAAWALACLPLVVWPVYHQLLFHDPIHPLRQILELALPAMRNYAVLGALAGAVFALVLTRAARRVGSVDDLSVRRTAAWGALGGLVLPGVALLLVLAGSAPLGGYAGQLLGLLVGGTVVGAALAAGTLTIARRAPAALPRRGTSPTLGTRAEPADSLGGGMRL